MNTKFGKLKQGNQDLTDLLFIWLIWLISLHLLSYSVIFSHGHVIPCPPIYIHQPHRAAPPWPVVQNRPTLPGPSDSPCHQSSEITFVSPGMPSCASLM